MKAFPSFHNITFNLISYTLVLIKTYVLGEICTINYFALSLLPSLMYCSLKPCSYVIVYCIFYKSFLFCEQDLWLWCVLRAEAARQRRCGACLACWRPRPRSARRTRCWRWTGRPGRSPPCRTTTLSISHKRYSLRKVSPIYIHKLLLVVSPA